MYTIKLDKVRELKFNFSSLMYLQQKIMKEEIGELLRALNNEIPPFELIPMMLFAGLKKKNDDIKTEQDVIDILDDIEDMDIITKAAEITTECFQSFMNKDSKNESSPTAKIPTKRKKKNGAGGEHSEKPLKSA